MCAYGVDGQAAGGKCRVVEWAAHVALAVRGLKVEGAGVLHGLVLDAARRRTMVACIGCTSAFSSRVTVDAGTPARLARRYGVQPRRSSIAAISSDGVIGAQCSHILADAQMIGA